MNRRHFRRQFQTRHSRREFFWCIYILYKYQSLSFGFTLATGRRREICTCMRKSNQSIQSTQSIQSIQSTPSTPTNKSMYNASSTNSAKYIAEWEGHTGELNELIELIELVVLIKRFLDHWNHAILNLPPTSTYVSYYSMYPEVQKCHGNTGTRREHGNTRGQVTCTMA